MNTVRFAQSWLAYVWECCGNEVKPGINVSGAVFAKAVIRSPVSVDSGYYIYFVNKPILT